MAAAREVVVGAMGRVNSPSPLLRTVLRQSAKFCQRRKFQSQNKNLSSNGFITNGNGFVSSGSRVPDFGLFFDIDGVIVRGRKLLPYAREAFRLLTDKGKFVVPTIFVTNAGNCLRQTKADQLSEWLDVKVEAEQVIMSHSPLKLFRQLQDKHVLVSGQGPVRDIAKYLGFTKVTTIEALRQQFPTLDMVDHRRQEHGKSSGEVSTFEQYFPRIEAVILFGEPIRWETNLQLIIDILLTDGHPTESPLTGSVPYPHLPVLACNVDLMWMAEASMPRFGHGCFLHCLESLYKKISGNELRYTALVGKPSEITYHHSELMLQEQARKLGWPGIRRMYCIGDNPDVDIYGANLYNRFVQKKQENRRSTQKQAPKRLMWGQHGTSAPYHPEEETNGGTSCETIMEAEACESILVCTGVYSINRNVAEQNRQFLTDHSHRDFIIDHELKRPSMIVPNVHEAVRAVFQHEGYR